MAEIFIPFYAIFCSLRQSNKQKGGSACGQNNSDALFVQLQLKNGELLRESGRGGKEDFEIQFEEFNRGLGHIGIDDVQALRIGSSAADCDIIIPLAG